MGDPNMTATARSDGASKWDAVTRAIEKMNADWLPLLVLACILAFVVVRVTPHITDAIVKDRENKRRHHERMTKLKQKLETRRKKRQGNDGSATRRGGRSRS
jgi:hypothetical protein